jgi:hypothetical protein
LQQLILAIGGEDIVISSASEARLGMAGLDEHSEDIQLVLLFSVEVHPKWVFQTDVRHNIARNQQEIRVQ